MFGVRPPLGLALPQMMEAEKEVEVMEKASVEQDAMMSALSPMSAQRSTPMDDEEDEVDEVNATDA